jgi:uncharacterized protein (TIGR00288 family)
MGSRHWLNFSMSKKRNDMNSEQRVAIFLDAENLTQWIKLGGLEMLLEELSSIGSVVVRKAYARWTNTNLATHQATLNRLGFELVHTFHPVSGKNSADIQIVVDVMEYAARENLQSIALATGDSDFSPLFRRLRELGKQVVGAGPRSALSESVKSSCSRFFYTDSKLPDGPQDEATRNSAFDDAADLLETTLKTFDGFANCSTLKNRMLNIDSAFDEKMLGFKSFTDFVRSVEGVNLVQDDKTWSVSFGEAEIQEASAPATPLKTDNLAVIEPIEQYRRMLRKKHWRAIPASVLVTCLSALESIGALPRPEIQESAALVCNGHVTTTDVKKATELLMKAGLMRCPGTNKEGEKLWEVAKVPVNEMLWAIDRAMTARLLSGLKDTEITLDKNQLRPLLLSEQSREDLERLFAEARKICRTPENHND